MKNKRLCVLVTGVGCTTGQSIIKSLNLSNLNPKIIATDINPLSAGLYRCDVSYLVPPCNAKDHISVLKRIILKERVDAILIGSTPEVPALSYAKKELEEGTGVRVVVSDYEIVSVFYDKLLTCKWLKDRTTAYPKFSDDLEKENLDNLINEVGFPVLAKPRQGTASKGIRVIKDEDQLQKALEELNNHVIQEFLNPEDEEYTCGLFFDKNKIYKGCIVLKRDMLAGGTYRAIVEPYLDIKEEIKLIAREMDTVGPINIQLRKTRSGVKVFEINPRFSSSGAIMSYFGFNTAEAAIRNFVFDEDILPMDHDLGISLRYFNEVFIKSDEYNELLRNGSISSPHAIIENYF